MNRHPTLIDQLNDLRQTNPPNSNQPHTIQGHVGDVSYEVEVREVDSIGCRLGRARITGAQASSGYQSPATKNGNRTRKSSPKVCERAADFCERVTYLSENLAMIEAEESAETAIVRSTSTTPQADGNGYFEAVITPGQIELQRYRSRPGEPREPTDFAVTHESLRRIVDDAVKTLMTVSPKKSHRHRS